MSNKNFYSNSPNIEFGVIDTILTERAKSLFSDIPASDLDLLVSLAWEIWYKKGRRSKSDPLLLRSLITSLATGNGTLMISDSLYKSVTSYAVLGLQGTPPRPMSDHLKHLGTTEVRGFQQLARKLCTKVAPFAMKREMERQNYVSVFVDRTGIEMKGEMLEKARKSYDGKEYWLQCAFIGDLWVSGCLYKGGVHVDKGWRKQLEKDVAPLLSASDSVWVRADNPYYNRDFVNYCNEKGWDYSVSVPHATWKDPLLEQIERLPASAWTDLDKKRTERAAIVTHRPTGWQRKHSYVVVRTVVEKGQPLMFPHDSLILVSRDDLSAEELLLRHRGKQKLNNVLKGPLQDLDLHKSPCHRLFINQAYYAFAQLAQALLSVVEYELLP